MMVRRVFPICFLLLAGWSWVGFCADETQEEYAVPLTKGKPYIHVVHEGRSIRIERIQDPEFELKGYFAKTARKCPPFCIHPMKAAPDVETIGEVELFEFMETQLRDGTGVLIDARTPTWYKKGTIPGAVNYPFTEFSLPPEDPAWEEIFVKFGAKPAQDPGLIEKAMQGMGLSGERLQSGKWDFSNAKNLVLFCNGPACGQSPHAIKGLLAAGYPAQKLFYFRGGMQMWELWGLTTVVPASE
jgi:rhodanese-related sulfurtransferase